MLSHSGRAHAAILTETFDENLASMPAPFSEPFSLPQRALPS